MPYTTEIKDRIVSHARERFFREGFSKTSIDELTAQLSMSKKTFYQIFKSKEDLLEHIVERKLGEINASMEYILSQPHDSVQKLHEIIRYMGNTLSSMSKQMMMDMQRQMPDLWTRIEQFRRERLTKNITLLLQQGMEEGFVRKNLNTRVFLLSYLASIQSIMQPSVLSHESFSSKEALEAIMDIFFQGILTETARTRLHQLQLTQSSSTP